MIRRVLPPSSSNLSPRVRSHLLRAVIALLVVMAGGVISARHTAAVQTVPPAYTHSWYINWPAGVGLTGSRMQALGAQDGVWDSNNCSFGDNGSQDKVVVLALGHYYRYGTNDDPYGGYGTILAKQTAVGLRFESIAFLVEQYAESYFWNTQSGCPHLRLALGTSNSYPCAGSSGYAPCGDYEAGQQWANLVGDVQNWLVARGYDARVVAHAADDIETGEPGGGWSCAGQARAFVDGFASNNWAGRAMLDFGDAVTSSNCWSIQDVHYVAWGGNAAFVPLPQGYHTANGVCYWTTGYGAPCYTDGGSYVGRGFGVESSVGPVAFKGPMTECVEPDPVPYPLCNGANGFGPQRAWERFWAAQSSFYYQTTMPFLTNIKDQP